MHALILFSRSFSGQITEGSFFHPAQSWHRIIEILPAAFRVTGPDSITPRSTTDGWMYPSDMSFMGLSHPASVIGTTEIPTLPQLWTEWAILILWHMIHIVIKMEILPFWEKQRKLDIFIPSHWSLCIYTPFSNLNNFEIHETSFFHSRLSWDSVLRDAALDIFWKLTVRHERYF